MNAHSYRLTRHARDRAAEKGFPLDALAVTFAEPECVYPSGSHPGQWRVCGNGVCMVGTVNEEVFTVITVYANRVLTPLREDQLKPQLSALIAKYSRVA